MGSEQRKVLVVDDDPVIREMMADMLDVEGYAVTLARNGHEALAHLQGEENYLVFLDVMMPEMDGQEVCQRLSADPQLRLRHIVVIMSAMDRLAQAATLDIDATMPKPFSIDDVMRVLRPFMGPAAGA